MAAMRLTGDEEEHTSLMQVSGERRQVAGDLARLARMAKHCGSCLVGLGAMLNQAEAREETTDNGDQDSNIFWKVAGTMVVMWTVLAVILTVKMTRKNPPLVMTSGAQTEKIWKPTAADMTIQSLRHELARRRRPVDGTKPELAARLSRAMP